MRFVFLLSLLLFVFSFTDVRTQTTTTFDVDGGQIALSYSLSADNNHYTLVFTKFEPKNLSQYETLMFVFFDRIMSYDVTFSGLDASTKPITLSGLRQISSPNYHLIGNVGYENDKILLERDSVFQARLEIPLYLVTYKKEKTYNIKSGPFFLTIPVEESVKKTVLEEPVEEKYYTLIVDSQVVLESDPIAAPSPFPQPYNPVYPIETIDNAEDIPEIPWPSPPPSPISFPGGNTGDADRKSQQFIKAMKKELRKEKPDWALLNYLADGLCQLIDDIGNPSLEHQAENVYKINGDIQSVLASKRSYEEYVNEKKAASDKNQQFWMVLSGIFLVVVGGIVSQVMQNRRNRSNMRSMTKIQADLVRDSELDSSHRVSATPHDHVVQPANSALGKSMVRRRKVSDVMKGSGVGSAAGTVQQAAGKACVGTPVIPSAGSEVVKIKRKIKIKKNNNPNSI